MFWIENMCCLLRKPIQWPHFVARCEKKEPGGKSNWRREEVFRWKFRSRGNFHCDGQTWRQHAKLCTSWGNFGERFVRCGSKESQHKHGGCVRLPVEETCNTSFCLDCLLHRESRLELHCRSAGRGGRRCAGAAVAGPVSETDADISRQVSSCTAGPITPASPHRTIHRDSAKLRPVEI